MDNLEVRILVRCGESTQALNIVIAGGSATLKQGPDNTQCAYKSILEVGIPVPVTGGQVQFQASFWHDGLPVDAIPVQDWLMLQIGEPTEWAV